MLEVISDIDKQYSLRKTLQDYADEHGIHPNHLNRLFKKQMNTTFLDYTNKVRMDKAKDLLVNTKNNIADIAMVVGYEDSRYFSKVFRRYFNITPSKVRN